jgi:hypothetical protein
VKARDRKRLRSLRLAAVEILGIEGAMIWPSKTHFREAFPDRVIVFNCNVCVALGKIWFGDLCLTTQEELVAALAKQIGETVYVLYEADGRFKNERRPLLSKAVYSVTESGHTTYSFELMERTRQGKLQMRPREPDTRPRWRWAVLCHRPRLLHFWRIERQVRTENTINGFERQSVISIGARDAGATPLLVLGSFRADGFRILDFEVTWYPVTNPPRSAPRPLLSLRPAVRFGRLRLWLTISLWPGYGSELRSGYAIWPRWL